MKKCIKIGLLSAILTAGIVVAVSCSADDDDTQDNKYGTPYDRAIGNGNYILHNFISDNDNISRETAVDDTNHYLGLAKTYLQNKVNAFDKSLNNRASAKQYFSDFIQGLNNSNYYNYFNANGTNFDHACNDITLQTEQYVADIVKNLDDVQERLAFDVVYRIMSNEAVKEGYGKQRTATVYENNYKEGKEYALMLASGTPMLADYNLEQDYNNNFIATTDLTDQLLTTAANNISNRKGIDVRAEDLRQIVNFNLAARSLAAPHNITQALLNHKDNCVMGLADIRPIEDNLYTNTYTMSNNQEMGM